MIQQVKVEKHQHTLPTTRIGNEELENVYVFIYLCVKIAGESNYKITIATESILDGFGSLNIRHALTGAKLPVQTQIRL